MSETAPGQAGIVTAGVLVIGDEGVMRYEEPAATVAGQDFAPAMPVNFAAPVDVASRSN